MCFIFVSVATTAVPFLSLKRWLLKVYFDREKVILFHLSKTHPGTPQGSVGLHGNKMLLLYTCFMVFLGSLAMSLCVAVDCRMSRGRPECFMSFKVSIVSSYRIGMRDDNRLDL